jgi:hypothetical protein
VAEPDGALVESRRDTRQLPDLYAAGSALIAV